MNNSQKILLTGGLVLVIITMSYGFCYAVFEEHQTLESMGLSLASAFVQAAEGKVPEALASLEDYRSVRFEYIRDVHTHSHWGNLGLLLIVLGLALNCLRYTEQTCLIIALILTGGAYLFPLGVMLQTFSLGIFAQSITVIGSVAVVGGMAVVTLGFLIPDRRKQTV